MDGSGLVLRPDAYPEVRPGVVRSQAASPGEREIFGQMGEHRPAWCR
jgi:hypothetical protein